jgi:chaperone modulatory protein CbpM
MMNTENHSRNNTGQAMRLDGVILDELTHLSLADLCRACATHAERILALVDEGILTPEEVPPHGWRFTGQQLRRAQMALRLQNDLGVNLAGAALAVQLIEERNALREQLQRLDVEKRRIEIEIHDFL